MGNIPKNILVLNIPKSILILNTHSIQAHNILSILIQSILNIPMLIILHIPVLNTHNTLAPNTHKINITLIKQLLSDQQIITIIINTLDNNNSNIIKDTNIHNIDYHHIPQEISI